MKILVTGSSGMIGTRIFEKLRSTHDVVGADKRENTWLPVLNKDTLIVDLRYHDQLKSLPGNFDAVIHLAANARVYELVKSPQLAMDNMIINFNVFEFARQRNIKRIVFASSREVYGNNEQQRIFSEDMMRIEKCESPYSASKSSGEALLHAYQNVYGTDFVIVRFSNVYGRYDDSDRVIPLWLRQCQRNEDLVVFGEEKVLDFTYIDDTVDGLARVVERFDSIKNKTFNISCGEGIYLRDLAYKLKQLVKSQSPVILKDSRAGEVWKFVADISQAKHLLDYNPKTSIDEGLIKTVNWYKRNISSLNNLPPMT